METLQQQLADAFKMQAAMSAGYSRESEDILHAHSEFREEVERLRLQLDHTNKSRAALEASHAREREQLRQALEKSKREAAALAMERDDMLEAHTAVILDLHKAHGVRSKESNRDPTATGDDTSPKDRTEPAGVARGNSYPMDDTKRGTYQAETKVSIPSWLSGSSIVPPEAITGLKRLAHFASSQKFLQNDQEGVKLPRPLSEGHISKSTSYSELRD